MGAGYLAGGSDDGRQFRLLAGLFLRFVFGVAAVLGFVPAFFCGDTKIFEGLNVEFVAEHGELLWFDFSDDVGEDSLVVAVNDHGS